MDNNEFQYGTDTQAKDNTQVDFTNEIQHHDVTKTYSSTPIILGVIGLIGGFLIPLIGYCTAIPGIVISSKRKKNPADSKAKTGFILCLIAIIVSAGMHILNTILIARTLL